MKCPWCLRSSVRRRTPYSGRRGLLGQCSITVSHRSGTDICMRQPSMSRGLLQRGDVEAYSSAAWLHHALCLRRVRVTHQFAEDGRHDLPGNAVFVLKPAALCFSRRRKVFPTGDPLPCCVGSPTTMRSPARSDTGPPFNAAMVAIELEGNGYDQSCACRRPWHRHPIAGDVHELPNS